MVCTPPPGSSDSLRPSYRNLLHLLFIHPSLYLSTFFLPLLPKHTFLPSSHSHNFLTPHPLQAEYQCSPISILPSLTFKNQASPPTPSTSKPKPRTSTPIPSPLRPCSRRLRRRARRSRLLRLMGRGWVFRGVGRGGEGRLWYGMVSFGLVWSKKGGVGGGVD